ncbi:hypothetical protein ALC57_09087 [Trachymyrmex cornetzi]|uniref:Odorant receptor n=1 Tax=Trachymyrmex cornetzi TaxID=471704 RepID=A0A151J5X3_9HYME|nr:hypothetical protein ALC57_09087 [Trachymyrmex cornetzi]
MIDKQLQAYRTYQSFLQTLLTICGCWYMPTKSNKSTYYWSICTLLAMVTYTITNIIMSYNLRHDLRNMMKAIGVATAGVSAILKVSSFMIHRGSLINYHRTLNDLFEKELMQNEKIRMTIFSPLRTMYTMAYTYFTVMTALVLTYFAPSYIIIIRHFLLHFHLTTNYTLPLTKGFGYFWTVPDNFLYHFHLLYETSMVILSCTTATSVDSMFGFYVYQFTSTIRAMTFKLTNPSLTEKFSNLLRICVAKHQRLLQCRQTLEHVYGPIIFWHIIINAVHLCALIYDTMLFVDFNLSNALAFLSFAAVKLIQTFTYAWYGTILTNAGRYLSFLSLHPLIQKRDVLMGMMDRTFLLLHPRYHEEN